MRRIGNAEAIFGYRRPITSPPIPQVRDDGAGINWWRRPRRREKSLHWRRPRTRYQPVKAPFAITLARTSQQPRLRSTIVMIKRNRHASALPLAGAYRRLYCRRVAPYPAAHEEFGVTAAETHQQQQPATMLPGMQILHFWHQMRTILDSVF